VRAISREICAEICDAVRFTDPSGGSADSFTLCIAHSELIASNCSAIIIDLIREAKPPFSPEGIIAEFSGVLKAYGCLTVLGDAYAKLWPVEAFARYGIAYEQSAAPKADLYLTMLPLINSRRLSLLDLPIILSQACTLERSTRPGPERIDHAKFARDDVINAVAGAAWCLCSRSATTPPSE
jgi:hypothetical protein